MVSYFMKKYAMSEKGALNLKKAIFSHTLVNLTKLFAPMIGFMFLFQYIGILKSIESYNFTSVHYIALIVVMMIVMFLIARWDYVRLYTNVYNESANSRIELAEKLKKLPLSYFGKRDLADLAETMMNDMNLYETIFSHAVPHIYSTAISTSIIALMLIFYNWKLALAALWVIPISILIIFLSKKSQKKIVQGWIDDNRKVFDNLQENIEQIEQIKSYNLEDRMLNDFFEKLNASTKQKTKGEVVAGTLTGIAAAILKLGIISVAVIGVNMLMAGEVSALVYIAFLMLTASIYLPIEGIITFMSMIVMLDAVVGR
ncbi:ABC transporter transmembrane region, partial [Streptococcus mitis SK569]